MRFTSLPTLRAARAATRSRRMANRRLDWLVYTIMERIVPYYVRKYVQKERKTDTSDLMAYIHELRATEAAAAATAAEPAAQPTAAARAPRARPVVAPKRADLAGLWAELGAALNVAHDAGVGAKADAAAEDFLKRAIYAASAAVAEAKGEVVAPEDCLRACGFATAAARFPPFPPCALPFTAAAPPCALPFVAGFFAGFFATTVVGEGAGAGGGATATATRCQRTRRSPAAPQARRRVRTDGRVERLVRQEHLALLVIVPGDGEEAAAHVESGHDTLELLAFVVAPHAAADGVLQRRPVRHVRPVRATRAVATAAARVPSETRPARGGEAARAARIAAAVARHVRPKALHEREACVAQRDGAGTRGRDAWRQLEVRKSVRSLKPRRRLLDALLLGGRVVRHGAGGAGAGVGHAQAAPTRAVGHGNTRRWLVKPIVAL